MENFQNITVEEALKHPNWSMGKKITIDSATMAGKGLELIEAQWLFGLSNNQLEVVIHPYYCSRNCSIYRRILHRLK